MILGRHNDHLAPSNMIEEYCKISKPKIRLGLRGRGFVMTNTNGEKRAKKLLHTTTTTLWVMVVPSHGILVGENLFYLFFCVAHPGYWIDFFSLGSFCRLRV